MKTYKLGRITTIGSTFTSCAEHALKVASNEHFTSDAVEFEFNTITCLVNKHTNLDHLYRDYANAWIMDWKVVGPDCAPEYDNETSAELARRGKVQAEKERKRAAESAAKDTRERADTEAIISEIGIDLSDEKGWNDWKEKNTDPYGACVFEYAETWARLMQAELSHGKEVEDIAETTSHKMGYLGITGFMYGAAVSVLSKCWKHGEELRKWHNKKYNHKGDGVVNPAILTVR